MKKNSKVIAGVLSLGLLTTGVLNVQALTEPRNINASVPGLNQSSADGYQQKSISDKDGYLFIDSISNESKLDARAETAKLTNTGPWVRLSHVNKGYLLENSIKKDKYIQARFSSDVTSFLPITVTGTFQGN
ncbi:MULTISPECIES: hypothetical protein [Lysinibacillus]|jgi:hypothetical protein|uniref:Uncharacterized protein n=1 Tax=Lysinibacillus fusiformis TaxID=28031 RepID=A0A2I0UYD7_9BACI|nr:MULTISPECIES: hypothetical protein [Lysinibacillus]KUF35676.1 hypothetical protein AK833_06515 [Lysinibacillus sp. F5]MEE3809683.1 hypothetical protein [Lysinibacillus fusiformis]PKU50962.1 hypothetical protein CRI88_14885 [Lysinibacillus fusiformis]WCH49467.1 hypothetical protein NV349_08830 [Lysinibacillus sp. OF-1]SCY16540.1 hypothetical protein SAMN02787078_00963 [Lysinibacillus sp. SG9]